MFGGVVPRLDSLLGSGKNNRIVAVEAARGLAMTCVFLIHFLEYFSPLAPVGSIDSGVLEVFYPIGNLAGVFFVIITGCFLYRSILNRPVGYLAFLRRRLVKIYSVFLVVLASYLALSYLFPKYSKLPADPVDAFRLILENVLLLPGILPMTAIITVSWTLSYVVLYCLILPPAIEYAGMRNWSRTKRVCCLLMVATLCALIADWTKAYPLRLALLPVGALAAEALQWRKENLNRLPWLEYGALAAAFAALGMKFWIIRFQHVTVFACGAGLSQCLATALCLAGTAFFLFSARSSCGALLSWRPLRWLGNISYSYYLTHSLAIKFWMLITPATAMLARTPIGFWTGVVLAYALSLIPAIALFLLVEKPSARFATAPSPQPQPQIVVEQLA